MYLDEDICRLRAGGAKIGTPVHIHGDIDVSNLKSITIGNYVVLGSQSMVLTHGPIRPYKLNTQVCIDDLCWIGFRSIILPGVHINRGCIVGAGAVVTKSVPKFKIVAGNPARVVGDVTEGVALRTFLVRWVMNEPLGEAQPDWSLLTEAHICYVLGIASLGCVGEKNVSEFLSKRGIK